MGFDGRVRRGQAKREEKSAHCTGLKNPHPGGVPDTTLAVATRAKFALALPERPAGSMGPGLGGREEGRDGEEDEDRLGAEPAGVPPPNTPGSGARATHRPAGAATGEPSQRAVSPTTLWWLHR